jgi:ABC-type bacteriocin/lantibiotic exporter with double-glycine peptidase domain
MRWSTSSMSTGRSARGNLAGPRMTQLRFPRLRPRRIERTGDDTPAPSVAAYARRMTGWHQVAACLLATAVALLNLAPIELQRRIVDDAITGQDARLLAILGVAYVCILLLHRSLKLALGLYQSWLSQSAAHYTRRHLLKIYRERSTDRDHEEAGKAVSILGAEVDKLGGFVGEGPSQACVNIAMLLGAIGYMATVQPKIAALSLLLLVPQIVLTPIMQNRLNRLTERRVELIRQLGDDITSGKARERTATDRLVGLIFSNRMKFDAWKFLMKAALNLLNSLAPLSVLVWGGWLAIQGETSVGVLVAFVSGFERISSPIRDLINFYRTCAQVGVQHRLIADWMRR